MSKLNMPGFTAEASLATAEERYRMLGILAPDATHGKVVPQRRCWRICTGSGCYWDCPGILER